MRTNKKKALCQSYLNFFLKKKKKQHIISFNFLLLSAIQMHFQKQKGFLDEWEIDE